MQIFEYPYIIITILVFSFILLAAIGVYFAAKGVKTANGKSEKSFVNISKLENVFNKSAKSRADRCVIYIKASMENFSGLYSDRLSADFISELGNVLLETFTEDDAGNVSGCGDKNFIVFVKWNIDTVRENIQNCLTEINKILLKYNALNIIDVRFGSCFAFGTQVSFDDAMGRAKQACIFAKNKNIPYAEWDVTSGKALEKRIKIENNIEKEIDNNRFFLEYQPVLEAKTKKIIGAEVLSRLNSESDGVLTPGTFLYAVDSVGINNKFDYYIFEKNCKWISNDKKMRESYKYTINFSRSTLCDPQFAKKIIDIAEKYDLNYSCLAVEVLEDKNITGEARKQMIDNLSILKDKGISVLLDDFGNGFTTFADLQNLDISIVKIDKSITHNSVTDTGFIILKNLIRTSHDIGFKTLCEGIETKEQEEAVIRAGCDMLQGFYYYKPMPVAQLEKVFEKNSGGV